jgi:hypothetical protein
MVRFGFSQIGHVIEGMITCFSLQPSKEAVRSTDGILDGIFVIIPLPTIPLEISTNTPGKVVYLKEKVPLLSNSQMGPLIDIGGFSHGVLQLIGLATPTLATHAPFVAETVILEPNGMLVIVLPAMVPALEDTTP